MIHFANYTLENSRLNSSAHNSTLNYADFAKRCIEIEKALLPPFQAIKEMEIHFIQELEINIEAMKFYRAILLANVKRAYLDGKLIESRPIDPLVGTTWITCLTPDWNSELLEYRIKP